MLYYYLNRFEISPVLDGIEDCIKYVDLKKKAKLTFNPQEWQIVQELECLLKPFKRLTKYFSYKSRPTISLLLPLIDRLQINLRMLLFSTLHFRPIF